MADGNYNIRFAGGHYPGTGGTCAAMISTACELAMTVDAGTRIATDTLSLKFTYKSASQAKELEIVANVTTQFLLGVADFFENDHIKLSANTPTGVWTDGQRLLVASFYQHRILGWNSLPTSPHTPPDFVLGTPSKLITGNLNLIDRRTCSNPEDIESDGTIIAVSCYGQNRVLIWNSWPKTDYAPADRVIGQPDFLDHGDASASATASTLNHPSGLALHAGRLYIADFYYNRVLIYDGIPTTDGAPADRVLGQPDFTSSVAGSTAISLRNSNDIVVAGGKLYISDTGNNRILGYNSDFPNTGAAADFVIGHSFMTDSSPNDGLAVGANTLNQPAFMAASADSLYVADRVNNRILRFSPLPTTSNPDAVQVYGQANFLAASDDDGAVTASTLDSPMGVAVSGSRLFATDMNNHRILQFDASDLSQRPAATMVWGQFDSIKELTSNFQESQRECQHPAIERNQSFFVLTCYYSNRILIWQGLPNNPFEPAKFVLGQADSHSTAVNAGGLVSANSLSRPYGASLSGNDLWVNDSSNHRLLRYHLSNLANFMAADLVIGQADFLTGLANRGGTPTATSLKDPGFPMVAGNKLFLSDAGNNRILIFNSIPTQLDTPADLVLGQSDMISALANRGGSPGANTLSGPTAVWSDGNRLAVLDYNNSRVLLWNSLPTTSGQSADVVLGQSDFLSNQNGRGAPDQNSLFGANAITMYKDNLLVLDRNNNRIMVWSKWPTSSGQPADKLLFQPDFSSREWGLGEKSVADVNAMSVFEDSIIVTDRQNFRLLGFPLSDSL